MLALCRLILLLCALVACVCGSAGVVSSDAASHGAADPLTAAQPSPANAGAASRGAHHGMPGALLEGKAAALRALLARANDTAAAASEAVSAELSRALVDAVLAASSTQPCPCLDVSAQASFSPSRFTDATAAAPPTQRVVLVREVAELRALLGRVNDAAAAVSDATSAELLRARKTSDVACVFFAVLAATFYLVGVLLAGSVLPGKFSPSETNGVATVTAKAAAPKARPRSRVNCDLAPLALPLATPSDYQPLPLVLNVVSRLPADARLHFAEVSRSMRAVVADPLLWVDVDLSTASGCGPVSEALVDAALTASSRLCSSLDVSGHVSFSPSCFVLAAAASAPLPPRAAPLSADALCALLRARGVSLRVLRALCDCDTIALCPCVLYCSSPPSDKARFANIDAVVSLLAAAPRCERLDVDVSEDAGGVRLQALLRRAPPFTAVTVRRLAVGPPLGTVADVLPVWPEGLWPAASLLRDSALRCSLPRVPSSMTG